MNEIRSYASLSGSLLARKGGAKPAMRPRAMGAANLDDLGWDDMGYAVEEPTEHVPSSIAALTPAPKFIAPREDAQPVHVQQRAIAERYAPIEPAEPEPIAFEAPAPALVVAAEPVFTGPVATPAPSRSPTVAPAHKRSAVSQGRKSAFTLRLDAARHLRLRLATAVTGQSAQQLVTGALDRFLESLPEVGSMADQLPSHSAKRS